MNKEIHKLISPMKVGLELDEELSVLPDYSPSIMQASQADRIIELQNLYQVFIPNQMSREIYGKLYLALLRSFQKKQSINSIKQFHQNGNMVRQKSFESIIGGADSCTIIGPSGIGKSSAVSRVTQILMDVPSIYINDAIVIPCLQVQAPADSSIKGLLLEILRKTDEALGSSYYANALKSHSTVDMLIGSVSSAMLNHCLLLIVDEIQNVVNSKNGKTVIGTLTQLINNSGVSICMVGTPEATVFFDQQMMLARRSVGLQYGSMAYDDSFKSLCRILLRYCYVNKPPQVDEGLLMWLYNHSGGNTSIVVSLIHDAQEIAILNGYEKLDSKSLQEAYDSRLAMLHRYLEPKEVRHPIKKKVYRPMVEKASTNQENTISRISGNAKENGKSIVDLLRMNGIVIEEVAI